MKEITVEARILKPIDIVLDLDEIISDNFEYVAEEVINSDCYSAVDIVKYVSRNKTLFDDCDIVEIMDIFNIKPIPNIDSKYTLKEHLCSIVGFSNMADIDDLLNELKSKLQ